MAHLSDSYKEKRTDYYRNVRREIIPLLPKSVSRVFEIGCGEGYTLSFLKDNLLCEWAGGIELFHDAAEKAKVRNIDLVLEGDVSNLNLPIEFNSMDVILCLDVLEHLVDPWGTLKYLSSFLKKNGILICSIPNVRNWKVVLPLIFKGEWTYTNEGLLDKTHLRFFTKKTAIELLELSGYKVETIECTGLEKWRKIAVANLITLNLFKPFLEFQYVIKAKKIE
jgi:2-polyprenyl-3-methyl-5-hydroxy-6-metoxy-1,4-benzoquinol methylase